MRRPAGRPSAAASASGPAPRRRSRGRTCAAARRSARATSSSSGRSASLQPRAARRSVCSSASSTPSAASEAPAVSSRDELLGLRRARTRSRNRVSRPSRRSARSSSSKSRKACAAEPHAVVLVEAAEHVHPEALARAPPAGRARSRASSSSSATSSASTPTNRRRSGRRAPAARRPTASSTARADDLAQPRVRLQPLHVERVLARDLDAVDELGDRPLLDAVLAERREDVRDVLHEGRVRPDHEHAPQPLAVRVEEERCAVEADRGLARARPALDRRAAARGRGRSGGTGRPGSSRRCRACARRGRGRAPRAGSRRRRRASASEPSSASSLMPVSARPSVRKRRRSGDAVRRRPASRCRRAARRAPAS